MEGRYLFLFVVLIPAFNGQVLKGPIHDKVVMCYVTTWATYREGIGKFDLTDIDPALCTHLVDVFAGLDSETNEIKSLDPWLDLEKNSGRGGYKQMVSLKEKYPHLKVIIAIGGWMEGSEKFSKISSTDELRSKFVQNVLEFLNTHKFDGIDFHWKYPALRGGKPEDKANFVTLLKMLKEAFQPRGYILTAALGADRYTMESAYDLGRLSKYLDLVIVMCYDYHGPWDGVVGANAPLKGIGEKDEMSVEFTIQYMLAKGVSPSKLVLGLPLYGRTYVLENPKEENILFGKTTTDKTGFSGYYTKEDGFIGYFEICLETTNQSSKWNHYWHDKASIPYIGDGNRIITYDNTRSIAIKVKMAMDYGLAGFMVWSIATDDFKGLCTPETDTYVDFVNRYNSIVSDPVCAKKAVRNLKLTNVRLEDLNDQLGYVVSGEDLYLRLPKPESNYPLMNTINKVITLAAEEKKILDEVKRVRTEHAAAFLRFQVPANDDGSAIVFET